MLPRLSDPGALASGQAGMSGTRGQAGQCHVFRREPHCHRAGEGGEECAVDRGLPALQIWLELGGWEPVELHGLAELREEHKVFF